MSMRLIFLCLIPLLIASCASPHIEIEVGEPTAIVQGIRPEEKLWGPYQFPTPYHLGDRVVVSVHVSSDDITTYGDPCRWFESRDNGQTWKEIHPSVADSCGVLLPSGDRISIPAQNSKPLDNWTFMGFEYKTPDYDFTIPAEEGMFPVPDGARGDLFGGIVYTYRSERLAPSLRDVKWLLKRLPANGESVRTDTINVEWPFLSRVVHTRGGFREPVLKDIFPRGNLKVGPDGRVWVTAFSGEGHINPENGQYSPYYSAELFVSDDDGHSFRQISHMEYPADGSKEYPYSSGGFSDSDIAFMPDGSMVWFFRSNWYGTTGDEWSPMYWSRSTDNAKTWSRPEIFSPYGTLPRLVSLECGVTMVVYGRPGIFIQATADKTGCRWDSPVTIMTDGDRSSLANIVKETPIFHEYDGAGGNPGLIAISPTEALLIYSDFYYPDEDGIKRKSILCRKISVNPDKL